MNTRCFVKARRILLVQASENKKELRESEARCIAFVSFLSLSSSGSLSFLSHFRFPFLFFPCLLFFVSSYRKGSKGWNCGHPLMKLFQEVITSLIRLEGWVRGTIFLNFSHRNLIGSCICVCASVFCGFKFDYISRPRPRPYPWGFYL